MPSVGGVVKERQEPQQRFGVLRRCQNKQLSSGVYPKTTLHQQEPSLKDSLVRPGKSPSTQTQRKNLPLLTDTYGLQYEERWRNTKAEWVWTEKERFALTAAQTKELLELSSSGLFSDNILMTPAAETLNLKRLQCMCFPRTVYTTCIRPYNRLIIREICQIQLGLIMNQLL